MKWSHKTKEVIVLEYARATVMCMSYGCKTVTQHIRDQIYFKIVNFGVATHMSYGHTTVTNMSYGHTTVTDMVLLYNLTILLYFHHCNSV